MSVPFDYGYPTSPGNPHYALYQPVLKCFLLTVSTLEEAQEIKLLASSRYSLYIVDLSSAENYEHNLIDNSCCENWKLSNTSAIFVGHSDDFKKIIKAEILESSDLNNGDVIQEKIYLQTILYYCKYCFQVEYYARKKVHDWIDGILDLDIIDRDYIELKRFIKQIKRILYLGITADQIIHDAEQIKVQINNFHKSD
jgi:hypothetical protein